MKYAVLLSSFLAVCAPQSTSHQKQKILDEFRYPNGVPPEVPQSYGPNTLAVSPGGMFEFNITSNQPAKNVSHLVAACQIAGGLIENAIKFTNQIKVQVIHGDSDKGCLEGDSNLGMILNCH
ncbi:hypothetical protein DSO57_1004023 [Entomophthora muscae]|uniref:Uncharacterized protein n=1 Tax=Entomophthora muscae TaxID=34485 RepID=A0ACC2T878_9FUNG|nr:hypothetical protein DSO57_1004023 [Entomophthora muscae]